MLSTVKACTTQPVDLLNEWVVVVDGVRRGRFVGREAVYYAARLANRYRPDAITGSRPKEAVHVTAKLHHS